MKYKIKEGKNFILEIGNERYKAHIYREGVFTTFIYLIITKKKFIRFLWFNLYINQWNHKYKIGYNKLIEKNIIYETINDKRWYNVNDVQRWVNEAINEYGYLQHLKKEKERQINNTKHLKTIKWK